MAAKRKYKWEEWFDQSRTVLVRGVDYHCSQSSMAGAIRNSASQRGARVHLTDTGDSIIVEVVDEIPYTNKVTVFGQHEPPALAHTS